VLESFDLQRGLNDRRSSPMPIPVTTPRDGAGRRDIPGRSAVALAPGSPGRLHRQRNPRRRSGLPLGDPRGRAG
jgi:hypothetical protein